MKRIQISILLSFLSVALSATLFSQSNSQTSNVLKTTVLLENSYRLDNSIQKNFYLYLETKAKELKPKKERIPLNISLVIDRSGSMAGDKLKYVKDAIHFVIDNLSPDDYLSIVQYSDNVDIVKKSTKVKDKGSLHRLVDQISSSGSTNLSGGMLEGYSQVASTQQNKFVNRVLLLSDGLANRGITDSENLRLIAQKKFREKGIGLSTFGVGVNFNKDLMVNLSEYGSGNFHFIETPDDIPEIFAQELSGLLSVVTQNTKLSIEFPEGYLRCAHVYGYPFEASAGKVEINFNDVFSGELKAVLIKLEVVKPIDKTVKFDVNLSYEDVVDKLESITENHSLKLQLTQNEQKIEEGRNSKVLEQVVYYSANEMFANAIKEVDKRNFEASRKILAQAIEYMETFFKSSPQTEELNTLFAQISDYKSKLKEMETATPIQFNTQQQNANNYQYMNKQKKVIKRKRKK